MNLFAITTVAHPAMINPAGVEQISVPYILRALGEASTNTTKEFDRKKKVPHYVETFSD